MNGTGGEAWAEVQVEAKYLYFDTLEHQVPECNIKQTS